MAPMTGWGGAHGTPGMRKTTHHQTPQKGEIGDDSALRVLRPTLLAHF